MKKLTINNLYKYTKNKSLKNDLKKYKSYLGYFLEEKDFEILKNQNFNNCYFYVIKEVFTCSARKEKIHYCMNYLEKKTFSSFHDLQKNLNTYYYYKLKQYNKEKRFYEKRKFYVEYVY